MKKLRELEREELEALYKSHTIKVMASMFGVNNETVRKRLIKLGIKRRPRGGERKFDPSPQELHDLYQRMSMNGIAAKFGVGQTVVWNRLRTYGIKLRGFENGGHKFRRGRIFSKEHREKIGLAHRGKLGPLNHNWKGGKHVQTLRARWSFEYREWRKSSLELRGYKCQECGAENGFLCECCGTKVTLHVHHIESFARVPERRFDPTNSEVLCPKCHHKRHRRKPRELLETPNDSDEGNQQPSAAGMR